MLTILVLVFSLSTSYKPYEALAKVDIKTTKALVRRVHDFNMPAGTHNDLGLVQFDLDAEFQNCFDWNVKQLFIYLTANYETINNVRNQIVLWDYIIQRGDNGKLSLKNFNPKYYMWDDGFNLRMQNITMTLNMNIVPNCGILRDVTSPVKHTFQFPSDYTSSHN